MAPKIDSPSPDNGCSLTPAAQSGHTLMVIAASSPQPSPTIDPDLQPLLPPLSNSTRLHIHLPADAADFSVPSSTTQLPKTSSTPDYLLVYLYISYLLCRWGDRMWEFAVGLFMIEIWKHSLVLASLYGLVETASVVAMGVIIGEWVDKFPRLKVIRASLVVQNLSTITATLLILILLLHSWPTHKICKGFNTLVIAVNVFGGISALASLATKIALERDWVVVMAESNPSWKLTRMNATMRRIDLSCKLIAAIFVGFVMSLASVPASAILIATWNVACVGIEYWLLLHVYNGTPGLRERKFYHLAAKLEVNPLAVSEFKDFSQANNRKFSPDESYTKNLKSFQEKLSYTVQQRFTLWEKLWRQPLFEGWRIYTRQEMMLAGIALSLLSVSVLSFGTLMTASLKWRGVPAYALGLARGCAALVGICATLSYPILHARLQTLKAGLCAIILQWSLLAFCVISTWLQSPTASTALLMGGAAAARAGLWMFDLSVTQLMQETVPELERGVVAGVQNSIQSFCQLLSFAVGMIIPHPQEFWKLICMSFGSVTMAAILYAIQVYITQSRGASLSKSSCDLDS